MQFTGEYDIAATREAVWDGLNDPEILKQCIPGCDEIIKESDTAMSAKVTAKVGPVKAKFSGAVTLEDLVPPESYRIVGEGKGGPAGFAKGGAAVQLTEIEGGTRLNYTVDANVGGKLAAIGARLIEGTAKKMADEFFGTFKGIVETPAAASAPTDDVEAPAAARDEPMETASVPGPAAEPAPEPAPAAAQEPEPTSPPTPAEPEQSESGGVPMWVWVVGLIIVLGVLIITLAG